MAGELSKIRYGIINTPGVRISTNDGSHEIARAFLYVLRNDLHSEPCGYLEDVFVAEEFRGKGIGTELVKIAIAKAKTYNCYKVTGTSRYERPDVHEYYKRLGFEDWGKEFRINL